MQSDYLGRMRLCSGVVAVCLLSACSMMEADEGPTVDYREADSTKSLEVPPDLTRPQSTGSLSVGDTTSGNTSGNQVASAGSGTVSGSSSMRSGVLPDYEGVRFVRAGGSSWLEVDGSTPDEVWPLLDRFLRAQGLSVARREPTLGIIESGWAERFDRPEQGGLSGFVNRYLGSAVSDRLRDKYVLRLERMEEGGTRVFITNRVAKEVDANEDTRREANFEWDLGKSDPALEAEMARRLLVYLGMSKQESASKVADAGVPLGMTVRYKVNSGAARLVVDGSDRRRVFAAVGDALAHVGADVQSAEMQRGVYTFDWQPPKDVGEGSGLFGTGKTKVEHLQVQLFNESAGVRIKAADENGEPRSGAIHRALLRQIAVAMGANEAAIQKAEKKDQEESAPEYQAPDGPQM